MQLWEQIANLVSAGKPKKYDEAVKLLVDLRDLYISIDGSLDFQIRLAALREDHSIATQRQLIKRLNWADL